MYKVYILKSAESGRYYVGHTNDLARRLNEHRQGKSSFGKRNEKLEIVFCKDFEARSKAADAEQFIKKQKSRIYIAKLIVGKYRLPI